MLPFFGTNVTFQGLHFEVGVCCQWIFMNFRLSCICDQRCRACYIGETTAYTSYVIQAQRIHSQMYEDRCYWGILGLRVPSGNLPNTAQAYP